MGCAFSAEAAHDFVRPSCGQRLPVKAHLREAYAEAREQQRQDEADANAAAAFAGAGPSQECCDNYSIVLCVAQTGAYNVGRRCPPGIHNECNWHHHGTRARTLHMPCTCTHAGLQAAKEIVQELEWKHEQKTFVSQSQRARMSR